MKYDELPHDDAIERGIFAILLFLPDKFQTIVDELTPSDFYVPAHQQIWQAMVELFRDGKEIDFPNLRLHLQRSDVDPQPALTTLSEALSEEVRDFHLVEFVKEVKNKSLLRQIIRASKSHAYTAQLQNAIATELLTTIEKDMVTIMDKTSEGQPVDATGIVNAVIEDIDKGLKDGWQGFNSGFSLLDKNTGGLIPSQVWIVGAYTGVGKTFHILQILLNVLRQGGRVILFSTEMDRKLNMLRLIGNIAGLGAVQMMRNQLLDEEVERMKRAQEELSSFGDRLIIYDNVFTIEEIRMKTKKHSLSGGVNVVAVDYIQNLKGEGSIYERMSEAATELYRMAQELKPTLIIGSQVSQDAAGYKSKEAIEFKGAGEIAAVADVALWIKKDGTSLSDREVLMRKIRHGVPGKVHTRLEFPSGRVVDVDSLGTKEVDDDIKNQLG